MLRGWLKILSKYRNLARSLTQCAKEALKILNSAARWLFDRLEGSTPSILILPGARDILRHVIRQIPALQG